MLKQNRHTSYALIANANTSEDLESTFRGSYQHVEVLLCRGRTPFQASGLKYLAPALPRRVISTMP